MFQEEKVERNDRGEWLHSALRRSEVEDVRRLPEAEGMEFVFVDFHGDASDELEDLYNRGAGLDGDEELMKRALRQWEPTTPEGGGWFLLGIYDTEDGPVACFARPERSDSALRREVNERGFAAALIGLADIAAELHRGEGGWDRVRAGLLVDAELAAEIEGRRR